MSAAMMMEDTPSLASFFAMRESDDPKERKEYVDLRDRAAYVYVTGTFPTHLRSFFTSLLRKLTRYSVEHVAFDRRSGSVAVTPEAVEQLDLNNHPMVKKVREYIREGFRIQTSRGLTERRSYAKIYMFKEMNKGIIRITIKTDGSIKDGWN